MARIRFEISDFAELLKGIVNSQQPLFAGELSIGKWPCRRNLAVTVQSLDEVSAAGPIAVDCLLAADATSVRLDSRISRLLVRVAYRIAGGGILLADRTRSLDITFDGGVTGEVGLAESAEHHVAVQDVRLSLQGLWITPQLAPRWLESSVQPLVRRIIERTLAKMIREKFPANLPWPRAIAAAPPSLAAPIGGRGWHDATGLITIQAGESHPGPRQTESHRRIRQTRSKAMSELNPYEQEQVNKIAGWKAEPPPLITGALDVVAHPLVVLAEKLIPEKVLHDAVSQSYAASEVFAHREEILQRAGVASLAELRSKDLAFCDALAAEFAVKAGAGSLARSAAMAGTGGASVLIGVPLMMTYALKTVHTIGFCYGFSIDEPRERNFALAVLHLASAAKMREKQHALNNLRDAEKAVEEDAVEELAESVMENAIEGAVEGAAEQAAEELVSEQIIEVGAVRAIPLLGIAFGAATDAAMTGHIATVATLCFQERWLRANDKVGAIAADPKLARGAVRRAESNIERGLYWACFTASFMVTFPPMLLASFLPRKSLVVRGCLAGRDAARHDLGLYDLHKPRPLAVPQAG